MSFANNLNSDRIFDTQFVEVDTMKVNNIQSNDNNTIKILNNLNIGNNKLLFDGVEFSKQTIQDIENIKSTLLEISQFIEIIKQTHIFEIIE